jgi:cysteine desulfuration protein SufE
MDPENGKIPARLQEIIEDFQWCEGREKLELLLQYAESMPPMPERLTDRTNDFEQVHECMTPVFVRAENQAGKLHFYFEVPESSPTVRGFASVMMDGLNGNSPETVLQVPADFYLRMGLEGVLTHQRLHGIAAILAHIKALALKEIA